MDFNEVIDNRRSIRGGFIEGSISEDEIKTLISSAQKAPSWKNSQVSRYYAIVGKEAKETFSGCLAEFNQNNTVNAAAYIVTAVVNGRSGFERDGGYSTHLKDGFQYFDNGLAVENLCLKAYEMGFGSLIMGIYDEPAIREFLGLSDDIVVVSVVAIGKTEMKPVMPQRKNIEDVLTVL